MNTVHIKDCVGENNKEHIVTNTISTMAQEIERKFLVVGDYKNQAIKSFTIRQGYLSTVQERTVRIRTKEEKAYITIKGQSDCSGMKRYEWEKEIPFDEALELLMLCENTIIHKQRYEIMFEGNCFEVDEFFGENEGLTVAELELKTMDSIYTLPEWIGEEITGDTRYYNSQLCVNPFSFWK